VTAVRDQGSAPAFTPIATARPEPDLQSCVDDTSEFERTTAHHSQRAKPVVHSAVTNSNVPSPSALATYKTPSQATLVPPFSRWTPAHFVGSFIGFGIVLLSAAIFALARTVQPFFQVHSTSMFAEFIPSVIMLLLR
jgi:hypothetical protein